MFCFGPKRSFPVQISSPVHCASDVELTSRQGKINQAWGVLAFNITMDHALLSFGTFEAAKMGSSLEAVGEKKKRKNQGL